MDLISCRNLLIYFKSDQQDGLLNTFHYALRADGLLLLGKSESTGFGSRLFEVVDASQKLYRRRPVPTPRHSLSARFAMPSAFTHPFQPMTHHKPERGGLIESAHAILSLAYGPPGVLVNPDFEPLHFLGDSKRYFALPEEAADFSVFSLCRPELRGEIKALGYRILREETDLLRGVGTVLDLGGDTVRVRPVLRRIKPTANGADPGLPDLLRGDAGRRCGTPRRHRRRLRVQPGRRDRGPASGTGGYP